MIVFIVQYPTEKNIRDGMMQRVAAIDTLAIGTKRVYLDISFKRNFKRKTTVFGECIVEHLNYFMHRRCIKKYLNDAKIIYVHSIYNLLKVHFTYCPEKTVLDIHGVVPEELILMNKKTRSRIYSFVECKGINKCFKLVHVTKSMLNHYEEKYNKKLTDNSIILPIFECSNAPKNSEKWNDDVLKIAYVGGLQAWQNIDLMVNNIRKINSNNKLEHKFSIHLFFPQNQVDEFKDKYHDIASYGNVSIGTLPKNEIINFLTGCHLGYVLRDPIVVNKVSCPTKLIEYLECGLLPIIKSKDIGDFNLLGYEYIDMDLMSHGSLPDMLNEKVSMNYKVLEKINEVGNASKLEIKKLFTLN